MATDGAIFVRRSLLLLDRLRQGRMTTAAWLAQREEISLPTARRVIKRLQREYGAPLRWDCQRATWELTDRDWSFSPAELASRGELIALVYALGMAGTMPDPELRRALEVVRARLREHLDLNDEGIRRLQSAYSADRTDMSLLRDPAVRIVLEAIAQQRELRFVYDSPWSDRPPRRWTAAPLHLRQLDGTLYLLAREGPKHPTFNLAFLSELSTAGPAEPGDPAVIEQWRSSFGVWAGAGIEQVTVHLSPPASHYYAHQQWHPEQRDVLQEDGVLVRSFPAHLSPEVSRRLLSLGASVRWVEPAALRHQVRRLALELVRSLDRDP